ncbi:MAG: hypothetical protein ACHRHE_23170, partial [Tepidisphaerales bacterium]
MPKPKPVGERTGDRQPTRTHTRARVDAAIKEIRRCWRIGRRLGQKSHRPSGTVDGHGAAILERYRRVASRYTKKDIDRLIAQLRERQYAMGFHHLVHLASLTPETADRQQARENLKKRQEMQDRCIAGRMSHRDLKRAVQQEAGKRRQGGRPVELPFDKAIVVNR